VLEATGSDDTAADDLEASCESKGLVFKSQPQSETRLPAELASLSCESNCLVSKSQLQPEAPLPAELASDILHAYRADIDGLRAVAVVAVIVYHLREDWLPGGFTGVDIFFVISGFVVASSLSKHDSERGGGAAGADEGRCSCFVDVVEQLFGFYGRRLKRLSPAFVTMMMLTSFATSLVVPPWILELRRYYEAAAYSALGWSNNYFARTNKDYFRQFALADVVGANPYLHTWSLGAEEQFYMVFPIITAVARRSGSADASHFRHVVLLAMCMLMSALAAVRFQRNQDIKGFYWLAPRFWELAFGAQLLFTLRLKSEWVTLLQGRRMNKSFQLASLSVLILSLGCPLQRNLVFAPWALPPVLGATCFILAGLSPHSILNRCLGSKRVVYLGRISYPLYLWHWPALALFRHAGASAVGPQLAAVGLALGLAMLTFHFVEEPVRKWKPRRQWHIFAAFLPTGGLVLLWLRLLQGPLYGALYPNPYHDGPVVQVNRDASCACRISARTWREPPGAVEADSSRDFGLSSCFEERAPPLGGDFGMHYAMNRCWTGWWGLEDSAVACLSDQDIGGQDMLPAAPGSPVMFVIGDSHANAILPAFKVAVSGSFWIRKFTSMCGFFPEQYYDDDPDTFRRNCLGQVRGVKHALSRVLKPSDVVVLAQAHFKVFKTSPSGSYNISSYEKHILELRELVLHRHAKLLLLGDVTGIPSDGSECLPTWLHPAWSECTTAKSQALARLDPYHSVLHEMASRGGDVFFWNFAPLLCTEQICDHLVPGTNSLAFFDTNHLTEAGAIYLWPYLCAFLAQSRVVPTLPRP